MNIEDYEKYIADAPISMSRFQIENFVVKTEPPSGRYHFCCKQIASKVASLKSAEDQKSKDALLYEIQVFKEIADEWKQYIGDQSYEKLQERIWDEAFTYKLAICAVTGRDYGPLIPNILTMPRNSTCARLLKAVLQNQDNMGPLLNFIMENHQKIHPCEYKSIENVTIHVIENKQGEDLKNV